MRECKIIIKDLPSGRVSVTCEPSVETLGRMYKEKHNFTAAEGILTSAMNYIWKNMKNEKGNVVAGSEMIQ